MEGLDIFRSMALPIKAHIGLALDCWDRTRRDIGY